jgi:hypothetical protein
MSDRPSPPDKSPNAPSPIGTFIQTYSSFLSTFVIGAAGLVATSIWQYRQSDIAAKTADSQQKIATTQAENSWRIERAEILSKNLSVLASTGPETVEQRYGVLLSLTRGNLLDPDLAVSYALELGRDNAEYMKSVLASTADKTFSRLVGAYELTCEQRFGITRDVPICPREATIARSEALAELISEEIEDARRRQEVGPMELLVEERSVQTMPLKLSAMFGHYLSDLFDRRQWHEIERFEALSVGARLVAALVLAPGQPNSFIAASEAKQVDEFHDQRAKWLHDYLFGKSCNGECKGKIVDSMLTNYAEAQGRFDDTLKEIFQHPRGEVAMALARLYSRLLQCQVDPEDGTALRDNVLVPAVSAVVKQGKNSEPTMREELLSLVALSADPSFDDADAARRQAWQEAVTGARETFPAEYERAFVRRRATVQSNRRTPPPKMKQSMFCTAAEVELAEVAIGE